MLTGVPGAEVPPGERDNGGNFLSVDENPVGVIPGSFEGKFKLDMFGILRLCLLFPVPLLGDSFSVANDLSKGLGSRSNEVVFSCKIRLVSMII